MSMINNIASSAMSTMIMAAVSAFEYITAYFWETLPLIHISEGELHLTLTDEVVIQLYIADDFWDTLPLVTDEDVDLLQGMTLLPDNVTTVHEQALRDTLRRSSLLRHNNLLFDLTIDSVPEDLIDTVIQQAENLNKSTTNKIHPTPPSQDRLKRRNSILSHNNLLFDLTIDSVPEDLIDNVIQQAELLNAHECLMCS